MSVLAYVNISQCLEQAVFHKAALCFLLFQVEIVTKVNSLFKAFIFFTLLKIISNSVFDF